MLSQEEGVGQEDPLNSQRHIVSCKTSSAELAPMIVAPKRACRLAIIHRTDTEKTPSGESISEYH